MFKGSFVALVSPMDGQGRIDLVALRTLVDFHLQNGSDGLVIAGTTGESSSLTTGEFRTMISAVRERVAGAVPVVAGTGGADTEKTVRMTREAAALGADAALVVTPYYNRPMQSGLEAHFFAVADASDIPLLMYNVPSRTGVDMRAETTAVLARHEMIAGLKEAKPDMQRIRNLAGLCPADFSILSGDDGSCKEAMQSGAVGVISVAANVNPSGMHALCDALGNGRLGEADALDAAMRELFRLLAIESNPIPVKWAVREMGLISDGIRLPLLPLDTRHHDALRACLEDLQVYETPER